MFESVSPACDALVAVSDVPDEPLLRDQRASQTEVGDVFVPSPEDIQREITIAFQRRLSPELQEWAARYSEIGRRTPYLWTWCRQGVEVTMLSCVTPGLRDTLCDTKVLGVMLDVLLDDVADQGDDAAFLEYLLSLPHGQRAAGEQEMKRFTAPQQSYARVVLSVWDQIQRRARRLPCYGRYASLLRYDYLQLFNTMRYSHLVNEDLALLNLAEHDLYLPHNMHMMVSATLDVMASPQIDRRELGHVRQAVWHAQCMGRIGNLITTWQREVGERDFTSGVFARAVDQGDLTLDDLRSGDRQCIEEAILQGEHEAYFRRRWQNHRQCILAQADRVRSVDLRALVAGLERLICLHLGSRGYK